MPSANLTDRTFVNVCRGLGQQLDDEDFCDVTVTVGEKTFSCHRVVLASVSEYFKRSLTENWREGPSGQPDIKHEDVSPEAFGYLMDILYKGRDMVDNNTAKDILKMSLYLQIKYLEEYCVEFLQETLQPTVCLETWQFAEKYYLEKLAETSLKMAVEEIAIVSTQDDLLTLPKSMLLILLSLQQKLVMDDVCKTILRWVEADQDTRQIHLVELLPFICFTDLSSNYLCEMVTYLNHPFRDVIYDKFCESLTYYIKGQQNNDAKVRRRILARQPQPRPLNTPEIQNRAVMFGGYTESDKTLKDTYAFDLKNSFMERYSLAPMPEDIGLDFASCSWYNEIYVSGGSQLPTFFAVYKPGDNEWEVLPSLPDEGREQHAMAAISSSIYVLGGRQKTADGEKTISSSVLRYNTKTKEWSVFCQLTLGVRETTAATLGHRIYLFGGVDSEGANTDLVQWVDTLGGCIYQAGKLPTPTCGARALSTGGRIYIVRPEGDVLSMWESFLLAEHTERGLPDSKEKKENNDLSFNTISSTVSFREVGKFTGRRHFSACLNGGELIVCGGETDEQQLLAEFESISLEDGNTSKKSLILITGAAKFDLHLLNIPVEFLRGTAVTQPFQIGDKVVLRLNELQMLQLEILGLAQQNSLYNNLFGIPNGTGSITALAAESVTVNFPNIDDWNGLTTQLEHAP
ncbi:kelch-like protein 24 isoform X1 [Pomacea canaliculata]|uniref:kelch-like protein 24 isoform X1 n=2 Tax=Pomacea canaliculata TaxID=400727 RepID=UPI000D73CA5B|nr:kelch-like protein 24 isoform X1 [Pomacea canaliculata]XP_025101097.1 kelch-like protein 24 isoform X1 [Pomacea canaliculata]XP_025101098.1 kelch-like protein 24 isoform X1 [Pomacea canaliculata]XP_025101099.1 kelch-like protein 24 isoform X1 [Pomacea canaliculata]XP_025101100.1 kelch-like protein 24 isoform X1 [Pomacea canaliculata]XP_025101101.1 kelch-like protein 24 isoform X1 [Pomacea canaliculata]XP_025101102.1 kelch-like protein 24 isoform X1 [Pomacea canaliculata]